MKDKTTHFYKTNFNYSPGNPGTELGFRLKYIKLRKKKRRGEKEKKKKGTDSRRGKKKDDGQKKRSVKL